MSGDSWPPHEGAASRRSPLPLGAAGAGTLTFSILLTALLYVPWVPQAMGDGLDPSFRQALHVLYDRGLSFGTEVVYQYGPLGFAVGHDFHPATYVPMVAIRLFLAVAFALLATWMTVLFLRTHLQRALWLGGFVLSAGWQDVSFVLLPHLLLLVGLYGGSRARWSVLLAGPPILALLTVMRFNFLIMACTVLGLGFLAAVLDAWRETAGHRTARRLLRRLSAHQLVWWGVAFPPTLLLVWLATGQTAADLVSYLRHGLHLASVYSRAHSIPGPLWQPILFGLLALAWWILVTHSLIRRRLSTTVPVSLALAMLLFLAHKHAFARHDAPHATYIVFYLLAAVLLYGLLTLAPVPALRSSFWGRSLMVVLTLVLLASDSLLASGFWPRSIGHYVVHVARSLPRQAAGATRFLQDPLWFEPRQERAAESLRDRHPLPRLTGTVDIFPFDINLLLAHGLEYQPRPLLQSFQTADADLVELDAKALRWPAGPDHVLFRVFAVDWRYPATEDSGAWLEILRGYDPRGSTGEYLVLDQRERPRELLWGEPSSSSFRLNETWTLPDHDRLLWGEFHIQPTLLCRMATVLLREPALVVDVTLKNGDRRRLRLVPDMAAAGFLISPLVETAVDFEELYSGSEDDRRVAALRIVAPKSWAFEPQVTLRWREFGLGQ